MYDGVLILFLIFGSIAILFPGVADLLAWFDNEGDRPWSNDKYKSPSKNSLIFTRILGVMLVVVPGYFLFIK